MEERREIKETEKTDKGGRCQERERMEPAAMNQSGDKNLSGWLLGAGFVIHLLPPWVLLQMNHH